MSIHGRRPSRETRAGMFREDGRRTADLWTATMRFPFSTPNPQARRLVNDNISECRVAIPFLPKTLGMSPRSCEAPKGAPLPCGESEGMILIVAVRCPVCGEPVCLDRSSYRNNYAAGHGVGGAWGPAGHGVRPHQLQGGLVCRLGGQALQDRPFDSVAHVRSPARTAASSSVSRSVSDAWR